MNVYQTLRIETQPGQYIELWRWNKDTLSHVEDIEHERNIGELLLPPGHYVYYIVSGVGEYNNEKV